MVWVTLCPQLSLLDFSLPRKSLKESSRRQKILHRETMSIMFVDGAEAPSTNIIDMVSPYAPCFALWNIGKYATRSPIGFKSYHTLYSFDYMFFFL